MPIAHRLKKHDEDLFDGFLDSSSCSTGVGLEGFDSFESFSIGVDEFESDVEGDEELKGFEGCGWWRRDWSCGAGGVGGVGVGVGAEVGGGGGLG